MKNSNVFKCSNLHIALQLHAEEKKTIKTTSSSKKSIEMTNSADSFDLFNSADSFDSADSFNSSDSLKKISIKETDAKFSYSYFRPVNSSIENGSSPLNPPLGEGKYSKEWLTRYKASKNKTQLEWSNSSDTDYSKNPPLYPETSIAGKKDDKNDMYSHDSITDFGLCSSFDDLDTKGDSDKNSQTKKTDFSPDAVYDFDFEFDVEEERRFYGYK